MLYDHGGTREMPALPGHGPASRTGWVCYLLECADGTLYTGITNALERRLRMHAQGRASRYTRARRPVRLVYVEPARNRATASRREDAIKRLTRASKRVLVGA